MKVSSNITVCNSEEYKFCDFNYLLDEFQKNALVSIYNGENVLVCAATGNGKTSIAIGAIKNAFLKDKRVIYTAPIKALLNQKYSEFKSIFENVGIETGDVKISPDSQCVVMTTEILRNKLMLNDSEILHNVYCVIFDEVHYIKDPHRGNVWESCISVLPKNVQQVMLSATINKPEQFASWIENVQNENLLHLIKVEERKVPLEYYFYSNDKTVKIMDNNKNFDNTAYVNNVLKAPKSFESEIKKLNNMITYMHNHDMFPCAFFVMSKKRCEHYATKISDCFLDSTMSSNAVNEFNNYLLKDNEIEKFSSQINLLRNLVSKGIGIHHAGLNPLLKEIIEKLFSSGFLKVLFATGTFTVGLNMPIRTVAFTGLTVYSDDTIRNFSSDEFIQMCGRAGRRGLDTKGYVVINLLNDDPPELHIIRSMMTNQPDAICSRLNLDCDLVIDLISNGKNEYEIIKFIHSTLYFQEQQSELKYLQNEKQNHSFLNIVEEFEKKIMFDEFKEYLILKEKLNTPLRQNQLKKTKFAMEEKIKKHDLKNIILEYENFMKHKEDYSNICCRIEKLTMNDASVLHEILLFLKHYDYIDEDNNLTTKGTIASCVNGYNKIVVTEILISDWIQNLSVIELGILLSFFIKYSNDETALCDLKNNEVPPWMVEEVLKIKSYDNFEINFSFCCVIFSWMKKEKIESITTYNEGNFITQVNLLCQFIDNLSKICENNEMYVLFKKLEELKNLVRRDIVISQSLYL
jgi:superfamily II RNA helicase